MKKTYVTLLPSDRIEGDLIARIPNESNAGALIVVIDKKNPLFSEAAVGQVWSITYEVRTGWALGQLVSEIKLDYAYGFNEHGPYLAVLTDEEVAGKIQLPYSGRITDFTRYNWKFQCDTMKLSHYADTIVAECEKSTEEMYRRTRKISEIADKAVELLCEKLKALEKEQSEIEYLVYAQLDPLKEEYPTAEKLVEQLTPEAQELVS